MGDVASGCLFLLPFGSKPAELERSPSMRSVVCFMTYIFYFIFLVDVLRMSGETPMYIYDVTPAVFKSRSSCGLFSENAVAAVSYSRYLVSNAYRSGR